MHEEDPGKGCPDEGPLKVYPGKEGPCEGGLGRGGPVEGSGKDGPGERIEICLLYLKYFFKKLTLFHQQCVPNQCQVGFPNGNGIAAIHIWHLWPQRDC